jgi:hypothetical protein
MASASFQELEQICPPLRGFEPGPSNWCSSSCAGRGCSVANRATLSCAKGLPSKSTSASTKKAVRAVRSATRSKCHFIQVIA